MIPVERIEIEDGRARIETDYEVTPQQFVHPRGSDHHEGDELLQAGEAGSSSTLVRTINAEKVVVANKIDTVKM